MKLTVLVAAAGLAAAAVGGGASAADIHKCLDWEGTIVYQDAPCEKGTGIGTIPRDTSRASPDALRRAEEERRLLADILLAKASRQPAVQVIVPGGDAAGVLANAEPEASDGVPSYFYGGPAYGGGSRYRSRSSARVPNPITQSPILDSPAPCNTALCRRTAGVGR